MNIRKYKQNMKNLIFLGMVCFTFFAPFHNAQADNWNRYNINFSRQKGISSNFSGKYVVYAGSNSESFNIRHAWHNKKNYTSKIATSGAERQLLFKNREIIFYAKNKQGATAAGLDGLRAFPFVLPQNTERVLAATYTVQKKGSQRIAKRLCDELLLQPKTPNRFTQVVCLDQKTGLALKQVIFLQENQPLETLVFSELLYRKLDLSSFNGVNGLKRWAKHAERQTGGNGQKNIYPLNGLPEGFTVVAMKKNSGEAKHFVLSDGLIQVSLFLEPNSKREAQISKAYYIDGALAFAIEQTDEYRISAIGFMPPSGLKELITSVGEASQLK